jgi:hypothetical protein
MQLSLLDPRDPQASITHAMSRDPHLKSAIRFVRTDWRPSFKWPYVEAVGDVEGRQAWLVDDRGMRYVVVGPTVFALDDFRILDERVRAAAKAAFRRLDAVAA